MVGVEFARSSSPAYQAAVVIASEAPEYTTRGSGREIVHAATFPATRDGLRAALELWGVVRGWRTSRLLLRGEAVLPHERLVVADVLHCAARASEFTPPARYCRSSPASPAADYPPVPCRYWMQRWAYLLDRIDWTAPTRTDALRALLMEFSVARCPMLDLSDVDRDIAEWRPLTLPVKTVDVDEILRRILGEAA